MELKICKTLFTSHTSFPRRRRVLMWKRSASTTSAVIGIFYANATNAKFKLKLYTIVSQQQHRVYHRPCAHVIFLFIFFVCRRIRKKNSLHIPMYIQKVESSFWRWIDHHHPRHNMKADNFVVAVYMFSYILKNILFSTFDW